MDPNEFVTITHKKTGAVKKVKRADLPSYGLPLDYVSVSDTFAKGIQEGQLSIDQIPQDKRAGVSSILTTSGYDPVKVDLQKAENKKKQELSIKKEDEYSQTAPALKTILEEFQSVPAEQRGTLRGQFTGRLGFLFPKAKQYEEARRGLGGTLKGLVGQTGVLTEQDIKDIISNLPTVGQTAEESQIDMDRLNKIFERKYGKGVLATENTQVKKGNDLEAIANAAQSNPLAKLLLGTSMNISKDVGAGLSSQTGDAQALRQSQQTLLGQSSQLAQAAEKQTDPRKRAALYGLSQGATGEVGDQANQERSRYSEDVGANPLLRSLLGAVEIGGSAEGGNLLAAGGKKLAGKALSPIARVSPGPVLQKVGIGATKPMRAAVTEFSQGGSNLGTSKDVVKVAQQIIKEGLGGPESKPILEQLAKGKGADPNKVFDLYFRANKKTFSKGGDIRLSDQAEFYKLLREGLRKEIDQKIPEAGKQIANLRRGHQIVNKGKQAAFTGGLVGTGVGGVATLLNFLGLGRRQY